MIERRVRERRERERDLAHRELAGKVGQPHLEGHPALCASQSPHERVQVVRVRQRRDLLVDLGARCLRVRRASREQDAVGKVGMGDERFAQKRARAEQRAERADELRILRERANVRPRRGQSREESDEQARGLLRVRGVCQRVDESPRERGLAIAGRRTEGPVGSPRERKQMPGEVRRVGPRVHVSGPEPRRGGDGCRRLVLGVQRAPQRLE